MKQRVLSKLLLIGLGVFLLAGCGILRGSGREDGSAWDEYRLETKDVDAVIEAVLGSRGKYIILEDQKEESTRVLADLEEQISWDLRNLRVSLAPEVTPAMLLPQLEKELGKVGAVIESTVESSGASFQSTKLTIGMVPPGMNLPEPLITHEVTLLAGRKEADSVRLALIIDDFGFGVSGTEEMMSLDLPLTFAVIPFQAHSKSEAKKAAENGFEVLLHLPMQPLNEKLSPGPGAIMADMSPGEVKAALGEALKEIPTVVGINNHMGSLATARREIVRPLLEEVQQQKLFFVDSFTTEKSVIADVGRELGLPVAVNRLFLDNQKEVAAIKKQLRRVTEIALKQGEAVAIGHVHPAMAQALLEFAPKFADEGVELVFVSQLVK